MKKKKAIQVCFKRYEKKYMLSYKQYEDFLEGMREYTKPDIYGQTTNCNIYYDTDNWDLIRKSIEKPVYKEKLRVRSYGVPKSDDEVFIELKKKYDGIVYKRRITMEAKTAEKYLVGCKQSLQETQIGKEIEYFQNLHISNPMHTDGNVCSDQRLFLLLRYPFLHMKFYHMQYIPSVLIYVSFENIQFPFQSESPATTVYIQTDTSQLFWLPS